MKIKDSELAKILNKQIPNPYQFNQWYPAACDSLRCEVSITLGRGNNIHKEYLHIRKACKIVVKTPSGEKISTREGYHYFIIELNNPEAVLKDDNFY